MLFLSFNIALLTALQNICSFSIFSTFNTNAPSSIKIVDPGLTYFHNSLNDKEKYLPSESLSSYVKII